MIEKKEIDKKKAVVFVFLLLISIIPSCLLGGCTEKAVVDTRGWSHANTVATAVTLYGDVLSLRPSDNFKGYFCYDVVDHGSNYKAYAWKSAQINVGPLLKNFEVTVDGLDRTTRYYYIAVANCGPGVEDIAALSSNSFLSGKPTVNTLNATNIDLHSATLKGKLHHMGGASSCEVWFEYNGEESTHKTVYSTGDFSVRVDDLTSCQKYCVKAFAKNDVSTDHGTEIYFTPGKPIVNIKENIDLGIDTATLIGELQDTGGTNNCQVWFEYGTSKNNMNQKSVTKTVSTGEFSIQLNGLQSCETYYTQVKADNGICSDVSSTISFTPGSPSVETSWIGLGESHSATLEGELNNLGGTSTCKVWFEYGATRDNLDQVSSKKTLHSAKSFSITVRGLASDTEYYYRAVASNGVCTNYGSIEDFRTI